MGWTEVKDNGFGLQFRAYILYGLLYMKHFLHADFTHNDTVARQHRQVIVGMKHTFITAMTKQKTIGKEWLGRRKWQGIILEILQIRHHILDIKDRMSAMYVGEITGIIHHQHAFVNGRNML